MKNKLDDKKAMKQWSAVGVASDQLVVCLPNIHAIGIYRENRVTRLTDRSLARTAELRWYS